MRVEVECKLTIHPSLFAVVVASLFVVRGILHLVQGECRECKERQDDEWHGVEVCRCHEKLQWREVRAGGKQKSVAKIHGTPCWKSQYPRPPLLTANPIQSNPIQSNPIQSNPIQSNPIQSTSSLRSSQYKRGSQEAYSCAGREGRDRKE